MAALGSGLGWIEKVLLKKGVGVAKMDYIWNRKIKDIQSCLWFGWENLNRMITFIVQLWYCIVAYYNVATYILENTFIVVSYNENMDKVTNIRHTVGKENNSQIRYLLRLYLYFAFSDSNIFGMRLW